MGHDEMDVIACIADVDVLQVEFFKGSLHRPQHLFAWPGMPPNASNIRFDGGKSYPAHNTRTCISRAALYIWEP